MSIPTRNMEVPLAALVLFVVLHAASGLVRADVGNDVTDGSDRTTTPSSARPVQTDADDFVDTSPSPAGDPTAPDAEPVSAAPRASETSVAAPEHPLPPPERSWSTRAGDAIGSLRPSSSLGAKPTPWYRDGLLALGAVLGLIFAVVLLLRRFVPSVRSMSGSMLKVVARTYLTPKQSIALVQVGRRLVLVGVTPERLTSLGLVLDPDDSMRVLAGADGSQTKERAERFEEILTAEGGAFDDAELSPDARSPREVARARETVSDLRSLVTRLRALQESSP